MTFSQIFPIVDATEAGIIQGLLPGGCLAEQYLCQPLDIFKRKEAAMKKIIIMLLLAISIAFSNTSYSEQCVGPKIKGFCLLMTYNEVVENLNKLSLNVTKKDFDGGFFILINKGKSLNYSFTIIKRDNLLHAMSFSYDMLNASNMGKAEFVEMFCKHFNIPKMEYKFDGEWLYEYVNKRDGYAITIYDKSVKIGTVDQQSTPDFD